MTSPESLKLVKKMRLYCPNCGDLKGEEIPRFAVYVCDKCEVTISISEYKQTIIRNPRQERVAAKAKRIISKSILEHVNQCLELILYDDVDQVTWAMNDTYFWFVKNSFTEEYYKNANILQRFLNKISENLTREEFHRRVIIENEKANVNFRDKEIIISIIQDSLKTLTADQGIDFLGIVTGAYAASVPEPLFRKAKLFKGIHQTPDVLPIDDHLQMTGDMILFGWQYFWFYTWLGY